MYVEQFEMCRTRPPDPVEVMDLGLVVDSRKKA